MGTDTDMIATPSGRRHGFTLIELILVMAMLAAIFAIAAPSLSKFFRGRVLDSEARRFLALTRLGQNRAVSEGTPVVLWMNPAQGTYGIVPDAAYESPLARQSRPDTNRVSFVVGERITLAYCAPLLTQNGSMNVTMNMPLQTGTQPGYIRFLPDGYVDESSPYRIVLREGDQGEMRITQSAHRRYYEIEDTTNPNRLR